MTSSLPGPGIAGSDTGDSTLLVLGIEQWSKEMDHDSADSQLTGLGMLLVGLEPMMSSLPGSGIAGNDTEGVPLLLLGIEPWPMMTNDSSADSQLTGLAVLPAGLEPMTWFFLVASTMTAAIPLLQQTDATGRWSIGVMRIGMLAK